jgi:hypothetical protein
VAGEDRGVGVGVDSGPDPQQHALAAARAQHARELRDVLGVVDHDPADARLDRQPQLLLRLGVAVQVDALGREARLQRQVQLPAGGDVDAQVLAGEQPQHGGDRACLGGEYHLARTVVVGLDRSGERARAGAQVVLGHHVRRRAELARELDRVAAADREPAVLGGRCLGVDGEGRGGHDRAEA